jgi:hypothetical protein
MGIRIRAGRSGVRVFFLFSRTYRAVLGPKQPSVQWVPGLCPWGTRLEYEVDPLHPSGSEVNKEWSCTSTASSCLRDVDEDHLDRHT